MTDTKIASKLFGIMTAPEEIRREWELEDKTAWELDSNTVIALSENGLAWFVWKYTDRDGWWYRVLPRTPMRPEKIEAILALTPTAPGPNGIIRIKGRCVYE